MHRWSRYRGLLAARRPLPRAPQLLRAFPDRFLSRVVPFLTLASGLAPGTHGDPLAVRRSCTQRFQVELEVWRLCLGSRRLQRRRTFFQIASFQPRSGLCSRRQPPPLPPPQPQPTPLPLSQRPRQPSSHPKAPTLPHPSLAMPLFHLRRVVWPVVVVAFLWAWVV